MNDQQKSDATTTVSGNKSTQKLSYDELLDLTCYQAYLSEKKQFRLSYPLVNIHIVILQKDHNIARKNLAQKYMVYAFRSFIRKWVMNNYGRIIKYFNTSVQGMHQDMMDVYQEVYIFFFDLIHQYRCDKEVFFAWYLRTYLYFWMNNRYKVNKKEQIKISSLESIIVNNDDSAPISLMDGLQALGAKSVTGQEDDLDLEDRVINNVIISLFERNVINNPKHFKSKSIHKTYLRVYNYFFVEGKNNKSDLARQMGISQQKVRYYLDKILRMFYAYMRDKEKSISIDG